MNTVRLIIWEIKPIAIGTVSLKEDSELNFSANFYDKELSEPDFLNRVRIFIKEYDDYGKLHVRRYKCMSDLK